MSFNKSTINLKSKSLASRPLVTHLVKVHHLEDCTPLQPKSLQQKVMLYYTCGDDGCNHFWVVLQCGQDNCRAIVQDPKSILNLHFVPGCSVVAICLLMVPFMFVDGSPGDRFHEALP